MNKYFTERERYQLEILLQQKVSKVDIAKVLNKNESTIYREIKRGTVVMLNSDLTFYKKYCADTAQSKYEENKINKGVNLKIGNNYKLAEYIERLIKDYKYSPYAVSIKIKQNQDKFGMTLHYQTIYRYIDSGLFLNISNADLPVKKNGVKRTYERTVCLHNLKGTSIEERPKEILDREEFGHWEMDTVIGKKKKSKNVMLVFTERKERIEIVLKADSKHGSSIVKQLNNLERRFTSKGFRDVFKTITVDNGSEFLDYESLEKSIHTKMPRTKLYYCHPFASCERGSNENQNKLIRRHIPKGSNFDHKTNVDMKYIQDWINTYPRKIFDGQSSFDLLDDQYKKYFKPDLVIM